MCPGPRLDSDACDYDATCSSAAATAASRFVSVILSECLPWRGLVKHRLQKRGHINIQEAFAFRSLCRRAPARSRFATLQDPLVNLCIEAKGRFSSPALNRVLFQTWAEVLGHRQYPRGIHTPTWSLRADCPSRSREIDPPRLAIPRWVWRRISDRQELVDLAAAEIDAMEAISKMEVRWMGFTLAVASLAELVLGPNLLDTPGARGAPARGAHPGPAGFGRHCAAPGEADLGVRGVAEHAGGGATGGGGARGALFLQSNARIWLQALRRWVVQSRPTRGVAGHQRPAPMGPVFADFWLEGSNEVGGTGAPCRY